MADAVIERVKQRLMDGSLTKEQAAQVLTAYKAKKAAPAEQAAAEEGRGALGTLADIGGGLIRGAGSIGSTLLWPVDKAQDLYYGDRDANVAGLITGQQPLSRNEERRQAIDAGLTTLIGSDPESLAYQGGKLAGEIAGTAGAGGVLAKGAQA